MVTGVLYGNLFETAWMKQFILPLTILMIYPMMTTLKVSSIFSHCVPKTQCLIQGINFLFIPFIGFGIGQIFFTENLYYLYGLLLIALLPTSGMTISWTGFSKGNVHAAIKATALGLIVGSLVMPIYTKFFMGTTIALSLGKTFLQIGKVIFIPLLLGFLTQQIILRTKGTAYFERHIKKQFPSLTTLAVVLMIFVAMALKATAIVSNPFSIIFLLLPLLLFYGVTYTFVSFVGKFLLNRENAMALVYSTAVRNLSVALALALTVFETNGTDIALVISVAYIIQVQSAAWYLKLSERIFGPARETLASDVMTKGIFMIEETKSLSDAIALLDKEHIHTVAVVNQENSVKGLLTAQMIVRSLAKKVCVLDTELSYAHLHSAQVTSEKTPISDCQKLFKNNKDHLLLLEDDAGTYTGVLSESDILAYYATKKKKK